MKRALTVLAMLVFASLGLVASGALANGDKVTICHATGSESNPYVEITISSSAVEAHRAHQDLQDIIPAPEGGCPGEPADVPPTVTVTTPGPTVTVTGPTQTVTNTVTNTVTVPGPTVTVTSPAVTVAGPTVTVVKVVKVPAKVRPCDRGFKRVKGNCTKTVVKVKTVVKFKESKRCVPAKKKPPRCEGDCRPEKLREGASG